MSRGAFLNSLAATNHTAEDVEHVVFTHLHRDHVGWATDSAGETTFPNARYHLATAELRILEPSCQAYGQGWPEANAQSGLRGKSAAQR